MTDYPSRRRDRRAWIEGLRPERNPLDPRRAHAFVHEEEPGLAPGDPPIPISTLFLTNRECPWRCVMCDLWRNTLVESTPTGALAAQVRDALEQLPAARWVKLFTAGSFFDDRAVSPQDRAEIAEHVRGFERTIVECHPNLVDERTVRFAERLDGDLEVALGLESADSHVLARMNKGMTVRDYRRAARLLRGHGIHLRTFVLIQPPFEPPERAVDGAREAVELALEVGSSTVSLLPTRAGNGAMEKLLADGQITLPTQATIDATWDACRSLGRVLLDGWGALPEVVERSGG